MAFKLGPINFNAVAQGVGGLVFGNNEHNSQEDDGVVEQLLERIKNGVLVEDRRNAMLELQGIVAESRSAQLAFGAIGLPIILTVLKEERNDLDMIRGALETLVNALGSEGNLHGSKGQVQPGALNSELLAREDGSASLLLNLLVEEDFYVRYHTLCLLTMLSSNTSVRLQDAVLATPQGIPRLMDMMNEREAIRNEALLLLSYLTRSAEEIKKLAVFDGVFEKLFNIIVEEGGSDGGIVVQDCLELLNNIIRNNSSNQSYLRETLGFQPIVSLLKLKKISVYNFSKQKVINILCLLETVTLLLSQAPEKELGKDANVIDNQTMLAQNGLLDHLLTLSVEGRVSALAICCEALRCIGDLVYGHPRNCEILSTKRISIDLNEEPALHSIFRVLLHTSEVDESTAAEYVIKCFCEHNPEGQMTLASTITSFPESDSTDSVGEDERQLSFGSMILKALKAGREKKDLEACRRAVRVLIHILKDNLQCKEKVLQIPLEVSTSPLAKPEYLMSQCMRYLASVGEQPQSGSSGSAAAYQRQLQLTILKLLIIWLADCSAAVSAFLDPATHLPCIIQLLRATVESPINVHVSGLAAVLLGESVIYNTSTDSSHRVVDVISQQIGLSAYFSTWEALQKNTFFLVAATGTSFSKSLTKSTSAEVILEDGFSKEPDEEVLENDDALLVAGIYDVYLVKFVQKLEPVIRDTIAKSFRQPKTKANFQLSAVRKDGECENDYIDRLKVLLQKQTMEMQEIASRNDVLVEELVKGGKVDLSNLTLLRDSQESVSSRVEIESLKQQIQDVKRRYDESESEVFYYKQLAAKYESDLKSLSDAYNTLEHEHNQLDTELKNVRRGGSTITAADLETAREAGRREAQMENEAEMNDLLVCLGQEESKVEKLRARLEEMGEDVDSLLEGIGEEAEDDEAVE